MMRPERKLTATVLITAAALAALVGGTLKANTAPGPIPWWPSDGLPAPLRLGLLEGVLAAALTTAGALYLTLRRRLTWRWAALLVAASAGVTLAGFWTTPGWGINDWDYYFSYHETLRHQVTTWGLPPWNPYTCGGTSAIGDPEWPLFAPTFALEWLLGVPAGLKAAIFLTEVVLGVGTLVLVRQLHGSVWGGLLAAWVLMFGSVNLLEIVEGHTNIFAVAWLPWVFWAWLNAYQNPHSPTRQTRRHLWPLLGGGFLTLMFFQGGIYLLFYTAFAFGFLSLTARHRRRAFLVSGETGLFALGFAAVKLVPVGFWVAAFPDASYATSPYTLTALSHILLGRYLHGAQVLANQMVGWHELGAYVGPFVLALAALGAWLARHERLYRALVVAVGLAVLVSSLGPLLRPLFDLVPYLPRSNISRVILMAIIPLALLAARAMDTLAKRHPLSSALVLGLVALDLMSLGGALSHQAFIVPPLAPLPAPAPVPLAFTTRTHPVEIDGATYDRSFANALSGYGTVGYCTVLGPPPAVRTIHDEGDNGPVSVSNRAAAADIVDWQPNRVRLRVEAPAPTEVVLNTNYAPGWFVNGTPAREIGNRVGTLVGAGDHTITFSFHPRGLTGGVAITAATLLVAARFVLIATRPRATGITARV